MGITTDGQNRIASLYDHYGDKLFRIAYSILLNQQDAEDAVQDVFYKIMDKLPAFHDTEQEKAWLVRVVINQCKDSLKKQKLRIYTPLEQMGDLAAQGSEDLGVLSIVLSLEGKYKGPLILYYFEGFSVETIGKILGIGKSAVKMRLARGREMVKKRLEEEKEYVGR